MPRYSPYGNHLGRYWPIASLALLVLSLSLGVAALFSADSGVLQIALTAVTIPAGFAVLIASNGYGMLSSHDDRFRLRQLLAVAGGLTGLAGLYLEFDATREMLEQELFGEAFQYFAIRIVPYAAIAGLMALSITRLSTRLRRLSGASDTMAGFGFALMLVSAVASLMIGFDLRAESGDALWMAMLIGSAPIGLSVVLVTHSLRQGGRTHATAFAGIVGSAVVATMGIAGAVWVVNLLVDAFLPDPGAGIDQRYLLGIHTLTPLALAALNLRIAMQFERWPIWTSAATGAVAVLFGIWVAAQSDPLLAFLRVSLPAVEAEVNGALWVWLAVTLNPLAISLYAIFCMEEPWQWYWEWLRARRGR